MRASRSTGKKSAERILADMKAGRAKINESLKKLAAENAQGLKKAGFRASDILDSEDPLSLFDSDDEDEIQAEHSARNASTLETTTRLSQVRSRKTAAFKKLKQLAETDPERVRRAGLDPERLLKMLVLSRL